MRILCLHGYGTNSSILENQLSTFLSIADQTIEPVFIDGEIECPKARGLGAFAKGPFHCYYDSFAPSEVKKSHEMLTEIIEEDGPFDGVLGFSQGGSLAVAYLLQHEIDHPNEPPPFKFAAIFSSVIGFTTNESYCRTLIENLSDGEISALSEFPEGDFSALSAEAKTLFKPMANALHSGVEGGFLPTHPDQAVFKRGDTSQIPRILHPSLVQQRVRVPTIHVVGKKDQELMLEQSSLMYQLCDPALSKWLEHSGGHDVPRQLNEAKAAVKAMEWAVSETHNQVWTSKL